MGNSIAFWILAAIVLAGALGVVILPNVFRAALALILCLLGVAGIYITLSADFLAAVQVLVYVGAISILIILAVMLTRDVQRGSPTGRLRVPALIVAALFFGAAAFAIFQTSWQVVPEFSSFDTSAPTTALLGQALFGQGGYILPVEIAPILLLAAIIGAIVLVREK